MIMLTEVLQRDRRCRSIACLGRNICNQANHGFRSDPLYVLLRGHGFTGTAQRWEDGGSEVDSLDGRNLLPCSHDFQCLGHKGYKHKLMGNTI